MLENRFDLSGRMLFSEHLCHSGFKAIIPIHSQPIHARPHCPGVGVIPATEDRWEQWAVCPHIVRLALRTLGKHLDECLCSVLMGIALCDLFRNIFTLGRGQRKASTACVSFRIPLPSGHGNFRNYPSLTSRQRLPPKLPQVSHISSWQRTGHHKPLPLKRWRAVFPAPRGKQTRSNA